MPLFTPLIEASLSCIPIRLDGSKAPATPSWKVYQTRRPTAEEATSWDGKHQAVAVICGKVSGNLELIDVDEPSLSRPFVLAVHDEAPDLYRRLTMHRTPRRNETDQAGCHLVYRCPGIELPGNTKLAMSEPEPQFDDEGNPLIDPKTAKQQMVPRTLIETRSTGGYFVTVGSDPRVHASGRPYEHAHGPELQNVENITPEERELLWPLGTAADRVSSDRVAKPAIQPSRSTPGAGSG